MRRHWKWIRLICVSLFTFTVCVIALPSAYATPPASIKLRYDLNSHILSVVIVHDNMDKSSHYIRIVEIKKNGTVVSVKAYDSQPQRLLFTYQYRIKAIEEDTFQAIVTCSQGESQASAVLTVAP
jgi:hypothetical protein